MDDRGGDPGGGLFGGLAQVAQDLAEGAGALVAAWGDYVYTISRDPQTEEEIVVRSRLVRSWEQ